MFERFTDQARRAVVLAQEAARQLNHSYIGTQHLLLGVVRAENGSAPEILRALGIGGDDISRRVESLIGRGGESPSGHIPFTPDAKQSLALALREALQFGHNYIGTEHLLLGLSREGDGVAAQVLTALGADLARLRRQVIQSDRDFLPGGSTAPAQPRADEPETPSRPADDSPPSRPGFYERFTESAQRVVVLAQEEARILNHNYIGTEHLLLGLIREDEGIAALVLAAHGVFLEEIRSGVEEVIGRGQSASTEHIPFTPRAKKVLELALREALQLRHNHIGTEHILLGIIRESDGVAALLLVKRGLDLNRVRQRVIEAIHGNAPHGSPAPGRPGASSPRPMVPSARMPSSERLSAEAPELPVTYEIGGVRLEQITARALQVVIWASAEAKSRSRGRMDTAHVLLGLARENGGVAALVLTALGIGSGSLRAELDAAIGQGTGTPVSAQVSCSPEARRTFELAQREAQQSGQEYVGTHHLLIGLIRASGGTAARVLAARGARLERLRALSGLLLTFAEQTVDALPSTPLGDPFYGSMTRTARDGWLDPVLGRWPEIRELIEALAAGGVSPVLVGERGAGTSSVMRGLALAAQRPDSPDWLRGTDIWQFSALKLLDWPNRGSLDDRVAALAAHAGAMENALLFVDDAFRLVSGAAHRQRAITHFEKVLVDGGLRVVAAATPDEYRACVTANDPLDGVLRPIRVSELTSGVAVEVLRDVRDRWESPHRVSVSDAAIDAAVALAVEYYPGWPLPGKAMDLLDRAAARAGQRVPGHRVAKDWENMPGHPVVEVTESDVRDAGRPL